MTQLNTFGECNLKKIPIRRISEYLKCITINETEEDEFKHGLPCKHFKRNTSLQFDKNGFPILGKRR